LRSSAESPVALRCHSGIVRPLKWHYYHGLLGDNAEIIPDSAINQTERSVAFPFFIEVGVIFAIDATEAIR
jgi:hypothetical protein